MVCVKPKLIVIMGPTASGKSDVAIKLAKKFNGEIISADSRQVYKRMDIGTGKVPRDFLVKSQKLKVESKDEDYFSEGIQHYLIDVTDPNEEFNVSHFKKEVEKAIEKILAKGKLPIVCGGTGFWIQAVVDNVILPDVKPNPVLRNMLRSKTAEELFSELQKLDPQRAENIDRHNHVRLIRAIEVATELGKVPVIPNTRYQIPNTRYNFLQIGIEVPRETLNEKIKKRLGARFNEGMIEEVENLQKSGVAWERLESFGLEYRWIARYLQGKISLEEMKEKLYFDIIHYAKRQITWLNKNKKIIWKSNYEDIEKETKNFLNKK